MTAFVHPRLALPFAALVLAACSSGGGGDGRPEAAKRPNRPASVKLGDERQVSVKDLSRSEMREFQIAWRQFVGHSPLWKISRRAWLSRGGAAPYVLSENLFRYFFSASAQRRPEEIARVGRNAALIGEPAVAYFAKPLVVDLVPLDKPITKEIMDPDDPQSLIKKTFHSFKMDDTTRLDAARVLAAIGPPAVPTLTSPKVLGARRPAARRYAVFALGRIATPEALQVLTRRLAQSGDWQDRAAAAMALGAALREHPDVRPALERALEDPDRYVRKKAQEALDGRTRLPL